MEPDFPNPSSQMCGALHLRCIQGLHTVFHPEAIAAAKESGSGRVRRCVAHFIYDASKGFMQFHPEAIAAAKESGGGRVRRYVAHFIYDASKGFTQFHPK